MSIQNENENRKILPEVNNTELGFAMLMAISLLGTLTLSEINPEVAQFVGQVGLASFGVLIAEVIYRNKISKRL